MVCCIMVGINYEFISRSLFLKVYFLVLCFYFILLKNEKKSKQNINDFLPFGH